MPSKNATWLFSKCKWTEENNLAVDYSAYEYIFNAWDKYGDIYALMLDEVKANGIRPWISLRMNDVHYSSAKTAYLRSIFYYEAENNGFMIGSDYGYFASAFDYSNSEVRDMLLAYIEEVLLRYDVFGLELDFMREIFCFDYINNPDCAEIMNDFMRQVADIVKKAEEKFGHSIKLMVRTSRSIENALTFGFDVKTWAEEGLIDVIFPSPRWEVTDSDIPVEDWKTLVGEDIAVFAGLESRNLNGSITTVEQVKGYGASFFSRGADGLYYQNYQYFNNRDVGVRMLTRETMSSGKQSFTVTYQDIVPEGSTGYKPYPFTIEEGVELPLNIGKIRADETVYLTISFNGEEGFPSVEINGIPSSSVETPGAVTGIINDAGDSVSLSDFNTSCKYYFTGIETDGELIIKFSNSTGISDYIDLTVEPADSAS